MFPGPSDNGDPFQKWEEAEEEQVLPDILHSCRMGQLIKSGGEQKRSKPQHHVWPDSSDEHSDIEPAQGVCVHFIENHRKF